MVSDLKGLFLSPLTKDSNLHSLVSQSLSVDKIKLDNQQYLPQLNYDKISGYLLYWCLRNYINQQYRLANT